MKNIPEALQEEFTNWTRGLEVVTTMFPDPSTVITIGKKTLGSGKSERIAYDVLAFFTLGNKWVVSCDARGVTADEAFYKVACRVSPLNSVQKPGADEDAA